MNEVNVNIEHGRIPRWTAPEKSNKLELVIVGTLITVLSAGAVIGCSGFYGDVGNIYNDISRSYK